MSIWEMVQNMFNDRLIFLCWQMDTHTNTHTHTHTHTKTIQLPRGIGHIALICLERRSVKCNADGRNVPGFTRAYTTRRLQYNTTRLRHFIVRIFRGRTVDTDRRLSLHNSTASLKSSSLGSRKWRRRLVNLQVLLWYKSQWFYSPCRNEEISGVGHEM